MRWLLATIILVLLTEAEAVAGSADSMHPAIGPECSGRKP